jgi:GT2 family glycosyltransferase/intein/homing endonuclease
MKKVTYIVTPICDVYICRFVYTLYKYSEPDSFNLIVIDQTENGFRKEVMEYLKGKVHLYMHPRRNLGYAKAMNEGVIHGLHWNTPYLCISNDDIEIMDKRWLQGIWDTFALDEKRIVGVVPMSPRVAGWGYGVSYNPEVLPYKEEYTEADYDYLLNGDFSDVKWELPKTFPRKSKGMVVDGAAFVMVYMKREGFEKVGLLDEKFFPGCILPDEQVLMGDLKYKAIKDIKVGDLVIGKMGKRCPVRMVMPKPYKGKVLELSFVGTTEKVKLTPDHKVFARSRTGIKGKRSVSWSRNKNKVELIEAGKLLPRDLVYCPQIYNKSVKDNSTDIFKIYGYFLAEGSYIKGKTKKGKKLYGLSFTFNINEKEYIKEVYDFFKQEGVSVSIYERPLKTISTVEVYSKTWAEKFRSLFGEYSWGKSIPSQIMKSDVESLRQLVLGYSNGDGGMCREFNSKRSKNDYLQLKMKSVSAQLLIDIRNILLKLGIPSLLYIKTEIKSRARRPAHELYISQNYLNRLYGLPDEVKKKSIRNEVFENDGKIFYPIKEIRVLDYEGTVYDLNVDYDHSFVVGIMAVKNSGEDYDWLARAYSKDLRVVSTSHSWIWHHWSKSKDLFASGELERPYYKNRPYFADWEKLWPTELNAGHKPDVWGHYTDENGKKVPLKRIEEVFVDSI